MEMHLHKTNSGYTQFLQVQHSFKNQVAIAGDGKGQYVILEGHPQIQDVVLDLLKLDAISHVVCAPGYFMIAVSDPRLWSGEVEGKLQHIVANHIQDAS